MLTSISDPFIHMERANKTYGFTIAVKELKETVPNIFRYASAYKRINNLTSQGLWEMFAEPASLAEDVSLPEDNPKHKKPLPEEILSSEPGQGGVPDVDPEAMEGETYNMCHFWSNFEIARLDWFRSKEYNDFFDMMDRSGGFWMERVRCDSTRCGDGSTDLSISGEMLQFIPSQPALYWHPRIYITSGTSDTGTQRYSIAQQMPLAIGSWLDLSSSR